MIFFGMGPHLQLFEEGEIISKLKYHPVSAWYPLLFLMGILCKSNFCSFLGVGESLARQLPFAYSRHVFPILLAQSLILLLGGLTTGFLFTSPLWIALGVSLALLSLGNGFYLGVLSRDIPSKPFLFSILGFSGGAWVFVGRVLFQDIQGFEYVLAPFCIIFGAYLASYFSQGEGWVARVFFGAGILFVAGFPGLPSSLMTHWAQFEPIESHLMILGGWITTVIALLSWFGLVVKTKGKKLEPL